ncbi:hypothetical protein P154DRAFT_496760 [Amniculicola lignicola CBS 123094]|uniref:RTA1-domain-containing protein n=1 Tax=Amniculicola lignicola CBS 123094 TaxID=1392246 RepID=A0A6A5W6L0_9PLEO|nr:hypothetical protein P154DRAFT_496760 [Amniculicola lignicola CBS 123094]
MNWVNICSTDKWTVEESPYLYKPSVVIAVIGVVLFTGVSLVLFYQFVKHRTWFLWALVIGMGMECFGFLLRAFSAKDVLKVLPFLGSYLFILLAPSFLAASCYGAFGRVLWFATPSSARNFRTLWVPPRWITPVFVTFDLFSFLIQLFGGAKAASGIASAGEDASKEELAKKIESGKNILLVGLSLQLACFGLFAIIGGRFLWVSRKWVVQGPEGKVTGATGRQWRSMNWAINGAATLITLRAFYRIFAEQNDTNFFARHEWAFWLLDALPIFATLVLFAAYHPGRILPQQYIRLRLDRKAIINSKGGIFYPPAYTINNPIQSNTALGPVPTGQANYYGYGSRGGQY